MVYKKINDLNGNGHHSILEIEDFEFISPTKQISEMLIKSRIHLNRDFLRMQGIPINGIRGNLLLAKNAIEHWKNEYKRLKEIIVPESLMSILTIDSKKDQIKVLKGLSISPEQLLAFLLRAGDDHGYLYSQYKGEHLPAGIESDKLPTLAEVTHDGEVNIIGETELSRGQIKQSIEQRHVAVSKFLDKGDKWHCLFLTYKSLSGEENYKGGQSHLHYISSSWGLPRSFVVEQLKSKNYRLPSLPHIDYVRQTK